MLARKLDAGTAVPPFAFITLFKAFTDILEMQSTGLSLEKASGVGDLVVLLGLERCALACLEADVAGKRARVQGTPSTEDRNDDIAGEAYTLAATLSPQTFVGVEVLLDDVKQRGSAESGTLISVCDASLMGTAQVIRRSPAEKSNVGRRSAMRGYFF